MSNILKITTLEIHVQTNLLQLMHQQFVKSLTTDQCHFKAGVKNEFVCADVRSDDLQFVSEFVLSVLYNYHEQALYAKTQ